MWRTMMSGYAILRRPLIQMPSPGAVCPAIVVFALGYNGAGSAVSERGYLIHTPAPSANSEAAASFRCWECELLCTHARRDEEDDGQHEDLLQRVRWDHGSMVFMRGSEVVSRTQSVCRALDSILRGKRRMSMARMSLQVRHERIPHFFFSLTNAISRSMLPLTLSRYVRHSAYLSSGIVAMLKTTMALTVRASSCCR
jgi:hypothetical protein